jgi:hypothetical protein
MGIEEIEQALLNQHGLRVTPAMSQYILQQLASPKKRELPIIAGDARTGVPMRAIIPLDTFQQATRAPQ